MVSPLMAAKKHDLATFLDACRQRPEIDPLKYFVDAFSNPDPLARVELANWMLDKGADANQTVGRDETNALHVLFSQRTLDPQLEAPLVQRLLAAGADINAHSSRSGTPLQVLQENTGLGDTELAPLYDVIFAHPGIDWDVPVSLHGQARQTLGERVAANAAIRPEMARRLTEYRRHFPS